MTQKWRWSPRGAGEPVADEELSRIFAAAEHVLRRSRYTTLKVPAVLEVAGVSTRAFYRHFRSKSELLLAVYEYETSKLVYRLERAVDGADGPLEGVAAWIRVMIGLPVDPKAKQQKDLFTEIWPVVLHDFPDEAVACVARLGEPLVQALEAGREAGVIDSTDADVDARIVLHLCTSFLQSAEGMTSALPQLTPEDALDFVMRAWSGGRVAVTFPPTGDFVRDVGVL